MLIMIEGESDIELSRGEEEESQAEEQDFKYILYLFPIFIK